MPVYTIEIGGQPIAVFNAGSKKEAERHVLHPGGSIAFDLVLCGLLPDEDSAREMVILREATPIEYNQWQVYRDRERNSDEPIAGHEDDETELMYRKWLVPVDYPTD